MVLSRVAIAAGLAASLIGVNGVAVYGQCGGKTYSGSTVCDAGFACVYSSEYYSQCLPGSAVTTTQAGASTTTSKAGTSTTTTKAGTGTTTSSSATSTSTGGSTAPADDPYTGYSVYLSPYYAAEIAAAVKNISDASLAAKAAAVAKIPTFTWLDVAAKVPTLGTYLANAKALQASTGTKQIVQIVIYDLPDRDCAALASNGEYSIANGGAANYQAYIDAISAQLSLYPDVRVVAVLEPDSLANLVTNLNVAKCANAAASYKSLTVYAIKKLTQSNLYLYLDAGHAGWLGWPANITPAAQLFGGLITSAGGVGRVRGLATNVANYNAFSAASPDPVTSGNANYDEIHYINALAPLLTAQGFPAHFIVDQSRSGVQNIRTAWGDWCNVLGAGFGTRPTTNTGSSLVDAIVWVKPGGESDGTSDQSSPRYDAHCGQSDATKPAPEAGTWFEAQFETLVKAASPSL